MNDKDFVAFKEDLIKRVVAQRVTVGYEEIEDLVNCLIKFIRYKTEQKEVYAIRLKYVGTMYRPLNEELEDKTDFTDNTKMYLILSDIFYNKAPHRGGNKLIEKSLIERVYGGRCVEEIQKLQNNS